MFVSVVPFVEVVAVLFFFGFCSAVVAAVFLSVVFFCVFGSAPFASCFRIFDFDFH